MVSVHFKGLIEHTVGKTVGPGSTDITVVHVLVFISALITFFFPFYYLLKLHIKFQAALILTHGYGVTGHMTRPVYLH